MTTTHHKGPDMIRIATHDLVGLLTDLALTAADPTDAGPTAAVLLHSARGYVGGSPGETSLLVGTSTDGSLVGHGFVSCGGSSDPMLWPIADVRAVIAVLKPLAKDRNHVVELGREGDQVMGAEDRDLFDEGLTLTFGTLDPADWPTEGARALLQDIRTEPAGAPPAAARTDFVPSALAPFQEIASRRQEILQTYRYHQRLPVLVQIGDAYRGVVRPFQWQDGDRDAGAAPSGDVYPLVLDGVA